MSSIKIWDNVWKNTSQNSDLWNKYMHQPRINFIKSIPLKNNSLILEAGCGSGIYGMELTDNHKVIFLDYSLQALLLTRKNTNSLYLVRADINNLPFKPHIFDAVLNLGVIEHFNHKSFIKSLSNILKPNGTLIIGFPNKTSLYHLVYKILYPLGLWKYGKEDMLSLSDIKKLVDVKSCATIYSLDYIPIVKNFLPDAFINFFDEKLNSYNYSRFIIVSASPKKLKIALLDPSLNGGIVRYTSSLYSELKNLSDTTLIIGRDSTYSIGNKILYTRSIKSPSPLKLIYNNFKLFFKINLSSYDIIHYEWDAFLPLTPLFLLASRKQKIWTAHNPFPHNASHNILLNLYQNLIYQLVDKIIVHSIDSKNKLTRFSDKIHIIPHGIYTPTNPVPREKAKNMLGIGINNKVILFYGFIRKYKGLENLISSFKLTKDPNYKLIIAGQPVDYTLEELKKLTKDDWRIILKLKYLSNNETDTLFSACDLVALPYTDIGQSGVLLQAIGAKRPCIASDLRSFKEIAEEISIYVSFDDNITAAKSIDDIMNNNKLRFFYEENCSKLIEKYSWKSIAQQHIEIYKK